MANPKPASMAHFLSTALRNAAWLLCAYWCLAVTAELLFRQWPSAQLGLVLRVLEHFPEKVLQLVGLWAPLQKALLGEAVSLLQLRLIYGTAVFLGFVALSLATGCGLWLLQRILNWLASRY